VISKNDMFMASAPIKIGLFFLKSWWLTYL
jgi:hypothetical protein